MATFVKPGRIPWLARQAGDEYVSRISSKKSFDKGKVIRSIQKNREVDAADIAEAIGTPQSTLIVHLREELKREAHCLSLPSTLLLVAIFASSVLSHFDMGLIKSVEDSIDRDIEENANFAFSGPPDAQGYFGHKSITDVHSYADFWSWFRLGFVPLLFQHTPVLSEGREYLNVSYGIDVADAIPPAQRGFYLNYGRILGGVRLVQERTDWIECKEGADGPRKYFASGFASDEKLCVGGMDRFENAVGLGVEMPEAVKRNKPEQARWLLIQENMSTIEQELLAWEANPDLLNKRTQKLELTFVVYNGEIGKYVVVYVLFHFARGGHIWKRIYTCSLSSRHYDGWLQFLFDLLFVALMAHVAFKELWDLIPLVVKTRGRGLWEYCQDTWNIVDWISIAFCAVIVALWVKCIEHTDEINLAVGDLADMDYMDPAYRSALDELYRRFDEQVNLEKLEFNGYVAIYPLILMLRLFKAFAAQPRLAVVTRTLVLAYTDLYHFLIVFAAIFTSYAIMGTMLFGQDLQEFSSMSRSLMSCFRVMLGDFDWESLSNEVGRLQASVWLVSFVIIIVLLLLNMLLAIVMETYSAVKASNSEAQTLVEQILLMKRRAVQNWRKERISLTKVVKAVEEKCDGNSQQIIQWQDFVSYVPGMKKDQALRLMTKAIMEEYHSDPADIDEVLVLEQKIDHRCKKLTNWLRPMVTTGGALNKGQAELSKDSFSTQDETAARTKRQQDDHAELTCEQHCDPQHQRQIEDLIEKVNALNGRAGGLEGELRGLGSSIDELVRLLSKVRILEL